MERRLGEGHQGGNQDILQSVTECVNPLDKGDNEKGRKTLTL